MSSNDQWRCWIGVGHAAAHALHARTRSARNYATQAVTKVGVLSRKDAFSEPGPVAFSSPVPVAVVSSIVWAHREGLDLSIESFDGGLISSQISYSTVAMMLPVSLTHPHAFCLLHEKKKWPAQVTPMIPSIVSMYIGRKCWFSSTHNLLISLTATTR